MKANYKNMIIIILLFIISICITCHNDTIQYQKETATAQELNACEPLFSMPEPEYINTIETQYVPVELDVLSRVVFAESANQSYRGKLLVAATIKNRYQTGDYTNLYSVVYQQGQYAMPRELPTIITPLELKQLSECKRAVIEVFNTDDTYGGVKYFCNPKTSDPVALEWFKTFELVMVEGEHYFYREKGK